MLLAQQDQLISALTLIVTVLLGIGGFVLFYVLRDYERAAEERSRLNALEQRDYERSMEAKKVLRETYCHWHEAANLAISAVLFEIGFSQRDLSASVETGSILRSRSTFCRPFSCIL